MQSIATVFGNHSFKETSAKINMFVMKCNDTSQKDLLGHKLKGVGKSKVIPTTTIHTPSGSSGRWISANHMAEDGVIISLDVEVSKFGGIYANGTIFISTRAEAPLIAVDVYTLGPASAPHKIRAFMGRGDIIPVTSMQDYGVKLYRNQIQRNFNQEELDELFYVVELNKGKKKPKLIKVKRKDGTTKRVPVPTEAKRKIRIRKY